MSVQSVTLQDARRVIAAGENKAGELAQPMNIAVVDADGSLVCHARMDGAWIGSVDISINKAFTARAFDISTKDLGELTTRRPVLRDQRIQQRPHHDLRRWYPAHPRWLRRWGRRRQRRNRRAGPGRRPSRGRSVSRCKPPEGAAATPALPLARQATAARRLGAVLWCRAAIDLSGRWRRPRPSVPPGEAPNWARLAPAGSRSTSYAGLLGPALRRARLVRGNPDESSRPECSGGPGLRTIRWLQRVAK